MEELKESIITQTGEIRCPVCGKLNAVLTGHEVVRNFKIRCRGSRQGREHFFIINTEGKEKE